jgi:hypothetical protein
MHLLELDPEVFLFIGDQNITNKRMSLRRGDAAEQARRASGREERRRTAQPRARGEDFPRFESVKSTSKMIEKISIDLVFYIEFDGVIGSTNLRRFLTSIQHDDRKKL